MKQLLLVILIFTFFTSGTAHSKSVRWSELKTGDLLLQSVPCYLCALIEKEEHSHYSHVGIVLKNGSSIEILQAWQQVKKSPLPEFLQLRKKETKTLVLRAVNKTKFSRASMETLFREQFEGLHYDESFLWANGDEIGEKFYCSEFVAKFMNRFLPTPLEPKAMHFNTHRDLWIQYFKGIPPDGEPGISPGDIERSQLFRMVGEF